MAKIGRKKAPKTTSKAKKKVSKTNPKGWPKQKFAYSHSKGDTDFDGGLRPYSAYRDLGFGKATGGRATAHVIRMTKPFNAKDVAIPHFHDVEFQMVYVLKGWFSSEFEGKVHTFREGSAWIQPPKIKHTVRGYSDDCELLEIILPADFDTVTLSK